MSITIIFSYVTPILHCYINKRKKNLFSCNIVVNILYNWTYRIKPLEYLTLGWFSCSILRLPWTCTSESSIILTSTISLFSMLWCSILTSWKFKLSCNIHQCVLKLLCFINLLKYYGFIKFISVIYLSTTLQLA